MTYLPKILTGRIAAEPKNDKGPLSVLTAALTAVGVGTLLLTLDRPPASAQAQDQTASFALPPAAVLSAESSSENNGPIRLARFSFLRGSVTWRSVSVDADSPIDGNDGEADWTDAALNMPLQQGAQIWVSDNSRAELQFDDGSRLRLNANTLITLQTLYSDADGEFTQINLSSGETYLRLTHKYAVYLINSLLGSVKASGPARLRIGSGDNFQVGVRQGNAAVVEANKKNRLLNAKQYLSVTAEIAVDGADRSYTPVQNLPLPDEWDRWNIARDQELDGYGKSVTYQSVPSSIVLCVDNLDLYGAWRDDAAYGRVWVPTVSETGWRPYSHGQWTWVQPWGWTWVGAEPWGWAPYHYGTWFHASYGWGWRPGPATQFWSPAVVSFYQTGSSVAWCPLAPREVYYPMAPPRIGFNHGNWSSYFSAGGAATYYPGSKNGVFEPRRWHGNGYPVNGVAVLRQPSPIYSRGTAAMRTPPQPQARVAPVSRTPFVRSTYVPVNAIAGGGSSINVAQFGLVTLAAHQRGSSHPAAPSLFQGQPVERLSLPSRPRPAAARQAEMVLPQRPTVAPVNARTPLPPTFPAQAAMPTPPITQRVYQSATQTTPGMLREPRQEAPPTLSEPIREAIRPPRTTPPVVTQPASPPVRVYNFASPQPPPQSRPSELDNYLRERRTSSNGNNGGTNDRIGVTGRTPERDERRGMPERGSGASPRFRPPEEIRLDRPLRSSGDTAFGQRTPQVRTESTVVIIPRPVEVRRASPQPEAVRNTNNGSSGGGRTPTPASAPRSNSSGDANKRETNSERNHREHEEEKARGKKN